MFVISSFLAALAKVVDIFFSVWIFLFIGRAIISFVSPDPYNPIVRFLKDTTEPVIWPIRRALPYSLRSFPVDVAFMLAFLLLIFVKEFSVQVLISAASYLRS